MRTFLTAFALGFAACLPPGAVFAEALRRGLEGGFRRALVFELGSLIGDALWAVIGLAGVAVLVRSVPTRVALGVVGTVLLAWLSWKALRPRRSGASAPARGGSDFVTGALVSSANPGAVAFWVGIGGVVAASGGKLPVFLAGYMLACLVYCPLVAFAIASGKRLLPERGVLWLGRASGVALGAFALRLGWATALLVRP